MKLWEYDRWIVEIIDTSNKKHVGLVDYIDGDDMDDGIDCLLLGDYFYDENNIKSIKKLEKVNPAK